MTNRIKDTQTRVWLWRSLESGVKTTPVTLANVLTIANSRPSRLTKTGNERKRR
jgi:hypothetical protein